MTTAYWRRKERLYSFIHSFGLELGLESSHFKSKSATKLHRASELRIQSFRATKLRTEVRKHRKTPYFSRSCNG